MLFNKPCKEIYTMIYYHISGVTDNIVIIKANTMDAGLDHMLVVTAYIPGSEEGTAEHHFVVNLPPYGGTCSVFPFEGKGLINTLY